MRRTLEPLTVGLTPKKSNGLRLPSTHRSGRRNAIVGELAPPFAGDPVGGPGGGPAQRNPGRTKISFFNPGSQIVIIYQPVVQALNSIAAISNVTITPTTGALGGCYLVQPNGGSLVFSGECQGQWNAFSASGITTPLTVSESNVS